MKLWKSETENDGQDGARDVTQKDRHERRDFPVFAVANDDVEVAAELVALKKKVLVLSL